jgi:hypothetical protein
VAGSFVSGVWLNEAAFAELEAAAQAGVPLARPSSHERCTVEKGETALGGNIACL